jgi:hypothetical protein
MKAADYVGLASFVSPLEFNTFTPSVTLSVRNTRLLSNLITIKRPVLNVWKQG